MKAIIEVKNERQFQNVIKNMAEATGIDVPLRDVMSYSRQIEEAFSMVECITRPVPLMNQLTNEPFTEDELIHAVSREVMSVFRKHIERFARKLPAGHAIYVSQCLLIVTDDLRDDDYGGDLIARAGQAGR